MLPYESDNKLYFNDTSFDSTNTDIKGNEFTKHLPGNLSNSILNNFTFIRNDLIKESYPIFIFKNIQPIDDHYVLLLF